METGTLKKRYSPPALKQLTFEPAKRLLAHGRNSRQEEVARLLNRLQQQKEQSHRPRNNYLPNTQGENQNARRRPTRGDLTAVRRIGWKHCPYCLNDEVYRSRKEPLTWQDRLCVLFLLRVVRCRECEERHYRPIFLPAPQYPGPVRYPRSVQNGEHDRKHERPA